MYQVTRGQPDGMVLRLADGACIPPDERNTDYQEFLAWKAAGNTPDEVEPVLPE